MRTEPILLEVLMQRFRAVAEEMGYALQRTGYTAFVNETADLGVALVTPRGEIFGYPVSIGISMFANLDFSAVLRSQDRYDEGDVVFYNDPYTTEGVASHLPDVNMLAPIFAGGELVCFAFAYVHSTDVGGNVPGSLSPSHREVFQEGLRVPPVKLYRAGQRNDDVFRLLLNNVRVPTDSEGDLLAMRTALRVADRRVRELVERYGAATFRAAMDDALDYGERRARQVLERIPDGTYRFADYLDDDVASSQPIKLCVAVTVQGDRLHIDFTGTEVQVPSAFNIFSCGKPHPWLVYKIMFLLLTEEPDLPVNAGLLRPVSVSVPEGSVLNCQFPAAVGLRTTTGVRVQDALFGALAQARDGLVPACGAGTIAPVVFAERDAAGRLLVNVLEPLSGGTGGHAGGDGLHARDVVDIANLRNSPVEAVERKASVRVLGYGLLPDSGGPGRWRGGCGAFLEFQVLAAECSITARGMERHRFRPWGLAGGQCGAGGRVTLRRAGQAAPQDIGKIDLLRLLRGDVVRIEIAGGGGHGNPLDREPARVLADVQDGFVSREAAEQAYGVVLDASSHGVNEAATAQRRAQGRAQQPPAERFTFDPERRRYEAAWTDAVWQRYSEHLYGLPPPLRNEARSRLWQALESRRASAGRLSPDDVDAAWQQMGQAAAPATATA
ncbi:hydantoinase B/oxoprolinase family protein [Aquabacterium sp. J223]|uniref:hydantoinase B/oxoprolinase family protein n=1 Tax=Aquabacterium sp. J223 TaxID=2898431 RepID=UPI0021AE1E21|nr:hydantoinase B/oxoprolinase family protein [Aquabacterium sp. J223]UUX95321.1 hydantoinase B/oxoprolinase family protein [Aquabacterium sp. J223]